MPFIHDSPPRSRSPSPPSAAEIARIQDAEGRRRAPEHREAIKRLIETIYDLALSKGLDQEMMGTWQSELLELLVGDDETMPAYLADSNVVDSVTVDLCGLQRQLHNDSSRVWNRNRKELHFQYLANGRPDGAGQQYGFKSSIETAFPRAFLDRILLPATQHSLARHSRVSGRYARMMGLTPNGVAREGGYNLARF